MAGARQTRSINKGFTLVELLVVIVIIAILASLLTTAIGNSKDKAKAVICRNNERQIELDFDISNLQREGTRFDDNETAQWIAHNVGRQKVWLCPKAPRLSGRQQIVPPGHINGEILNGQVNGAWQDQNPGGIDASLYQILAASRFTLDPADFGKYRFGSYAINDYFTAITMNYDHSHPRGLKGKVLG